MTSDGSLTFVIPVRHPDNAKDWNGLKSNLAQTAKSVAAQTSKTWRGFIVANYGADLPKLPEGFEVVRVDFPPNPVHDIKSAPRENVYDAFRLDKGRRVLAGLKAANANGHVMISDDDDFVSRRLAAFVNDNCDANGWFIRRGYVWRVGDRLIYSHKNFSHFCGTSHIIRANLYPVNKMIADTENALTKRLLGSHISIASYLAEQGFPLSELPFHGAIYRVGHAGAHSQSSGVIAEFFPKRLVLEPLELIRRASRLRLMHQHIAAEYLG